MDKKGYSAGLKAGAIILLVIACIFTWDDANVPLDYLVLFSLALCLVGMFLKNRNVIPPIAILLLMTFRFISAIRYFRWASIRPDLFFLPLYGLRELMIAGACLGIALALFRRQKGPVNGPWILPLIVYGAAVVFTGILLARAILIMDGQVTLGSFFSAMIGLRGGFEDGNDLFTVTVQFVALIIATLAFVDAPDEAPAQPAPAQPAPKPVQPAPKSAAPVQPAQEDEEIEDTSVEIL